LRSSVRWLSNLLVAVGIGSSVAAFAETKAPPFKPPTGPALVMKTPPGVTTLPPGLAGQALDLEKLRKLSIIHKWGLNAGVGSIQPSVWLTPQHPYLDAQTNLATQSTGFTPTTTLTASAAAPYGTIWMPVPPVGDRFSVYLNVAGGSTSRWDLVECIAIDNGSYLITAFYPSGAVGEEDTGSTYVARFVQASGGRFSALFEPTRNPVRKFLVGAANPAHEFTFAGCEITPVTP
jgi:hypothetical protein